MVIIYLLEISVIGIYYLGLTHTEWADCQAIDPAASAKVVAAQGLLDVAKWRGAGLVCPSPGQVMHYIEANRRGRTLDASKVEVGIDKSPLLSFQAGIRRR